MKLNTAVKMLVRGDKGLRSDRSEADERKKEKKKDCPRNLTVKTKIHGALLSQLIAAHALSTPSPSVNHSDKTHTHTHTQHA